MPNIDRGSRHKVDQNSNAPRSQNLCTIYLTHSLDGTYLQSFGRKPELCLQSAGSLTFFAPKGPVFIDKTDNVNYLVLNEGLLADSGVHRN